MSIARYRYRGSDSSFSDRRRKTDHGRPGRQSRRTIGGFCREIRAAIALRALLGGLRRRPRWRGRVAASGFSHRSRGALDLWYSSGRPRHRWHSTVASAARFRPHLPSGILVVGLGVGRGEEESSKARAAMDDALAAYDAACATCDDIFDASSGTQLHRCRVFKHLCVGSHVDAGVRMHGAGEVNLCGSHLLFGGHENLKTLGGWLHLFGERYGGEVHTINGGVTCLRTVVCELY